MGQPTGTRISPMRTSGRRQSVHRVDRRARYENRGEPLGTYERTCLFGAYTEKPVLVGPGTAGGNTWAPMTYSPKTQLAYVPGTIFDSVFKLGAEGPGRSMQSTTFHPPGVRRAGTLTAMDPKTNRS